MLKVIFNLSVFEIVMVNLCLVVLNMLVLLFMRYKTGKKYEKTKSVEKTIYAQTVMTKYIWLPIIFITALISSLTVVPMTDKFGEFAGFAVLIFVELLITYIILIFNTVIFYKLNRELRKTSITLKEQILMMLKYFLFGAVPMFIFMTAVIFIPKEIKITGYLKDLFYALIFIGVYIAINILIKFSYKFLLKSKDFEDVDLKDKLISFIKGCGIKDVKLHLWSTTNIKHANALVTGKDIYISDYLIDNFTLEETEAILAHEIGHIKKHHALIRTGLVIAAIVLFPMVGSLMDKYEEYFSKIPIWAGILIILILVILYFGLLYYYVVRTQERQADAYVLEVGISPEIMVLALYKLAILNNSVMKYNKADEKFMSHPSFEKRIKWIQEQGKVK